MRNQFLLLFLTVLSINWLYAQSNFSQTNFRALQTSFVDISTTGTPIAMTNNESGASVSPVEIGFSFNFGGTQFTQCMIHADGILRFGTAAPGAATDITVSPANSLAAVFTSTVAAFQNVVMPFFTNLVASGNTPQFNVLTSGSAPNRVCTIQWKDLRDADNAGGGKQFQAESISFAVNLYETTNDIEFVYGSVVPSSTSAIARNAAVGVKSSSTSFLGLYKPLAAAPFSKTTCFNATHHSFISAGFPFIRTALPPTGQAFRFFCRIANDVSVAKIYYDSISPVGVQRTGRVEALVVNEGTTAQSNITVSLGVSGSNTTSASINIASLAAGASQVVSFPEYTLTAKGNQTMTVTATAASDERLANNSLSTIQLVSQSRSQTPDFSLLSSAAVGFIGATGFSAVKVYGSGTRKLRQVRIPFSTYRNAVNVRIYEDGGTGGSPSSSAIASVANFFTTSENTMIVTFPAGVTVVDDYYVVVNQATTTNMGWRVVNNPLVRASRVYTSTLGTTWGMHDINRPWLYMLDVFEENAGPDVGIDSIVVPGCTYSNALDIKVRLRNFSSATVDFAATPATVTGFVTNPGNVETPFSITKSNGTLAPGATEEVTVLTGYNYLPRGYYLFNARTNLPGDVENGNDSLRFFIANSLGTTRNFTDSVCPLQSVTLTGSSVLGSQQWNVNGLLTSNNAVTFQPTTTTIAYFTGFDYRGCQLRDSVIVPVRTLGIPPKPEIFYKDTIFSHRIGFADTFRVARPAGHTISWQGPGTALGDSAYVLRGHGLSFFPIRAVYTRTADGCSNISDALRISYAPGVLLNSNLALEVCDSSFYDAGGATGITGNNFTRTFAPATPGTKMKLTIYTLDLATNADLFVHDGPTTSSPRIVALSSTQNGNTMQEFIASNESGVLTVSYDIGSFTSSGWLAGLTCHTPQVYRTTANGVWTNAAIWEKKAPGGEYVAATRPPLKGEDTIYVRHQVNLNTSIQTDQVVVEESGYLIIESPTSNFISVNAFKTVPQPEFLVKGSLSTNTQVQIFGGGGRMEVTGNLGLKGKIDLDSVIFNGSNAQMLGSSGGTGILRFARIDNAAGITMMGKVEMIGARFIKGLIHASEDAYPIFNDNPSFLQTANASSYVNGPAGAKRSGSEGGRLFPIGKNGAYRPILLSNTSSSNTDGTPDLIVAEVMQGAPANRTLPASITAVSQVRHYKIVRFGNFGSNYRVTLPYGADDGVTDPAGLTIAKDDGSGAWLDIGGTASGAAPGNIQSDVFNGFSVFVLANKTGGSNALPVTWISFEAFKDGEAAKLSWRTGTEANCSRFVIERSRDGNRFEPVTSLACANNPAGAGYSFTDKSPGNGTVYYRIRQVDANGNAGYSATRQVNFGIGQHIAVFPNPASQKLNIANLPARSNYRLTNVQGRSILSGNSAGGYISLQVGHLPDGAYFLQIENSAKRETHKIVVKK
jgi:hypothetical protein